MVLNWHYTRINILRSDKDRLLIQAALAGLINLMLVYFCYLLFSPLFPCLENSFCPATWWSQKIPFEYSGISFAAFLLGALGWIPLNELYRELCEEDAEIDKAIKEDADPFETLLRRAQKNNMMVLVTTNSEKVYVGLVSHRFNPATPTNFIGIQPFHSGYRDIQTKKLNLTTPYFRVYGRIAKDLQEITEEKTRLQEYRNQLFQEDSTKNLSWLNEQIIELEKRWEHLENISDMFDVIIPTKEIVSVAYHDIEVREQYFVKPFLEESEDVVKPDVKSN